MYYSIQYTEDINSFEVDELKEMPANYIDGCIKFDKMDNGTIVIYCLTSTLKQSFKQMKKFVLEYLADKIKDFKKMRHFIKSVKY